MSEKEEMGQADDLVGPGPDDGQAESDPHSRITESGEDERNANNDTEDGLTESHMDVVRAFGYEGAEPENELTRAVVYWLVEHYRETSYHGPVNSARAFLNLIDDLNHTVAYWTCDLCGRPIEDPAECPSCGEITDVTPVYMSDLQ